MVIPGLNKKTHKASCRLACHDNRIVSIFSTEKAFDCPNEVGI
jgi:hypothetical protein